MNWSISKDKIFSECQRKWFYYEIMAKKNSRDKDRFEAYILKQVGSMHSWRGNIVDYVIENLLVPEFNEGNVPPLNEIESFISKLMVNQLRFAQQKKYRDPQYASCLYNHPIDNKGKQNHNHCKEDGHRYPSLIRHE